MKTSIRESKYSEMFGLISITTLCLILVHIHNKIIRKDGLVASLGINMLENNWFNALALGQILSTVEPSKLVYAAANMFSKLN